MEVVLRRNDPTALRRVGAGAAASSPSTKKLGWSLAGAALGAGIGWFGFKTGIAAVVGVIAGGGAGYVVSKANTPSGTGPAPGETTFAVVLSPGQMSAIGLKVGESVTFQPPDGGKMASVLLSADGSITSTAGMVATGVKAGTTTLAASYSDTAGVTQTSTIPVTVS